LVDKTASQLVATIEQSLSSVSGFHRFVKLDLLLKYDGNSARPLVCCWNPYKVRFILCVTLRGYLLPGAAHNTSECDRDYSHTPRALKQRLRQEHADVAPAVRRWLATGLRADCRCSGWGTVMTDVLIRQGDCVETWCSCVVHRRVMYHNGMNESLTTSDPLHKAYQWSLFYH
jgi:hypothetical protein